MTRLRNVAVILAGGTGTRVGLNIPKQLIKIAGKPIIEHTIAAMHASPLVDEIVVMMTPGYLDDVRAIVHTYCVVWDGPVVFNDGEVVEACWVGMAELRRRVATDRFVPDSLSIATPLLHLDV